MVLVVVCGTLVVAGAGLGGRVAVWAGVILVIGTVVWTGGMVAVRAEATETGVKVWAVLVAILGTIVLTRASVMVGAAAGTVLLVTTGSTPPIEAARGSGMGTDAELSAVLGSLMRSISVGRVFFSTVPRRVSTAVAVVVLLGIPGAAGSPVSILSSTVCELMLDVLVEIIVAAAAELSDPVSELVEIVSGTSAGVVASGENASNSATGAGDVADASEGAGESRAFGLFFAASFSFFRKKTCCWYTIR